MMALNGIHRVKYELICGGVQHRDAVHRRPEEGSGIDDAGLVLAAVGLGVGMAVTEIPNPVGDGLVHRGGFVTVTKRQFAAIFQWQPPGRVIHHDIQIVGVLCQRIDVPIGIAEYQMGLDLFSRGGVIRAQRVDHFDRAHVAQMNQHLCPLPKQDRHRPAGGCCSAV